MQPCIDPLYFDLPKLHRNSTTPTVRRIRSVWPGWSGTAPIGDRRSGFIFCACLCDSRGGRRYRHCRVLSSCDSRAWITLRQCVIRSSKACFPLLFRSRCRTWRRRRRRSRTGIFRFRQNYRSLWTLIRVFVGRCHRRSFGQRAKHRILSLHGRDCFGNDRWCQGACVDGAVRVSGDGG